MVLALVCLSYGCGGGAGDYVFTETQIIYAGADTDGSGRIFFTSQSDPLVIIEAKEGGTLPESSSLTLKERDLEASEAGDYGSVSTKAYTLTGTVEKGGIIRPLTETMKPIDITVPNNFPPEYTEFWLGFKKIDDLNWQYQKIQENGVAVVSSVRMSVRPTEFNIKTYRLNYVFTIFAGKPEDLIAERVESFYLTATPLKYEYTASEGVALFNEDLKVSSFITANDALVFTNPNVVHELTFISGSSQGSNFKIDGGKANEEISLSPESDSRYVHRFIIDKYASGNSEISGALATFSFVLNLKGVSLNEFPDNFKVTATVKTHKNTVFTYDEAFNRVNSIAYEPVSCKVTMIEPNPAENVATNTRIVLRSEKEILWDDSCSSHIILYDEDNNIASVSCSVSENKKEIAVAPVDCLRYETTYSLVLRKGIPAVDSAYILGGETFGFVTIPASFTKASIAVAEDSLYKDAYKTNPSFVINFGKSVANRVEVENAIKVRSPEGYVMFKLDFNSENTIATISFVNNLKANTDYSIVMNNTVKDIENVDIAQFGVLNFTTIPNVTAELKAPANVEDASVKTPISIWLSPAIDWDDSCKNLISIVNADNRKTDFNCSYATSTGMLTLTPLTALQYDMDYSVNIEAGMINHESNQKLERTSFTFKTGSKDPDTGSEPEGIAVSINIAPEDYVNSTAVPPVISLGAKFIVDFKNTPRNLRQAENAIKIYSNLEEATKLSADWSDDSTKLTFTISQNMASETIRVTFIGEIPDSRNVLYRPFSEARFETTPFTGKGTKESPYLVALPKQLDLVRMNLSAHYQQINDIDLTDYVSTITDNYEINGFEPIGCLDVDTFDYIWSSEDSAIIKNHAFNGVYDGNNFKIKGLWQSTNEFQATTGLFAGVAGPVAEIRNVHLDNPTGSIRGSNYTGSIAGFISEAKITNCSNNIPITAKGEYEATGGIVACGNGTIDKCINNGKIHSLSDEQSVGGIMGCYRYVSWENRNPITISNCVNTADILDENGSYVAGISGQNYSSEGYLKIINCMNNGNIVSKGNNSCVSGICSYVCSDNLITSCVNTGNITGAYTAGLCVYMFYGCELSNCYSEGSVMNNSYETDEYSSYNTGALVTYWEEAFIKDTFTTKKTLVNNQPVTKNLLYGNPEMEGDEKITYTYILDNGFADEIKNTTWSGEATWNDSSKWILSNDKLPELVSLAE